MFLNDRKHVVGQFYPWWEMLIIFLCLKIIIIIITISKNKGKIEVFNQR